MKRELETLCELGMLEAVGTGVSSAVYNPKQYSVAPGVRIPW